MFVVVAVGGRPAPVLEENEKLRKKKENQKIITNDRLLRSTKLLKEVISNEKRKH